MWYISILFQKYFFMHYPFSSDLVPSGYEAAIRSLFQTQTKWHKFLKFQMTDSRY